MGITTSLGYQQTGQRMLNRPIVWSIIMFKDYSYTSTTEVASDLSREQQSVASGERRMGSDVTDLSAEEFVIVDVIVSKEFTTRMDFIHADSAEIPLE